MTKRPDKDPVRKDTEPTDEAGLIIIDDPSSIPVFAGEAEEAMFWNTHTYSEELLGRAQRVSKEGDDIFPPARARANPKRPVSLRLDEDTLARLKRLATRKRTNYQTLLKNFVNERLYEEEKREGMLP